MKNKRHYWAHNLVGMMQARGLSASNIGHNGHIVS